MAMVMAMVMVMVMVIVMLMLMHGDGDDEGDVFEPLQPPGRRPRQLQREGADRRSDRGGTINR
eukprot:7362937-Lingulodinium_polyedra.AAC.1